MRSSTVVVKTPLLGCDVTATVVVGREMVSKYSTTATKPCTLSGLPVVQCGFMA